MKQAIRLNEEISKGVNVKKSVTTKIQYYCESDKDRQAICENIKTVLIKHLEGSNLAKITYELDTANNIVEVVIDEHLPK